MASKIAVVRDIHVLLAQRTISIQLMIRWTTAGLLLLALSHFGRSQSIEEQLRQQSAALLAQRAVDQGDAARGAIVFFHASMSCGRCHATQATQSNQLGPMLAQADARLTNEAIVESILEPSKTIRPGYETVQLLMHSGQVHIGLLVERQAERTLIRDAQGMVVEVSSTEIEKFGKSSQSLMPAGQVNQLSSQQQFLDLVKYLIEIRDGGVARARQLQPSESLLAIKLPEYESRLDHAGLIGLWGDDSFKRGEAIYLRVCANCHGTHEQLGSLPTSLRFADGKFKNGHDPYAMYRTLTRGFGFMPAQTWMVPQQKYDVIHYIREAYLKPHNPLQWTEVTEEYLAGLPVGETRGPDPSSIETWSAMDYGPNLAHCFEVPGERLNIAYKGIAVRLDAGAGGVARGSQWILFDTDTMRMAAGWFAGDQPRKSRFIDWRDIQMNGQHGIHPKVVGTIAFRNSVGPGWAAPASDAQPGPVFADDQRTQGRDGRRYGPLPRAWAQYQGLYHYDSRVVFAYAVDGTSILETPQSLTIAVPESESPNAADFARLTRSSPVFVRSFRVAARTRELVLQLAESGDQRPDASLLMGLVQHGLTTKSDATVGTNSLTHMEGRWLVKLPPGPEQQFSIWLFNGGAHELDAVRLSLLRNTINAQLEASPVDFDQLTRGGPPRWPQRLTTQRVTTNSTEALASDLLTAPESNPWLAQMRFSGLDFFSDGSLAVCTWDGDVWRVRQRSDSDELQWQRIASGLYQPLGLKVIADRVHLTCRDQLCVLEDLNGDGETDFYRCLNNDHQVTEHFHEFAMGLQVDAGGNFYYAKSGRHALPAVVPQHGTLLRVTPDGGRTDILATGFRAANGVCLNPDGSFVVTDQEGFWNPKNRINWVNYDQQNKPKFYGNMFGYHDVVDESDQAMEPPLCWITNKFDRSPGELLWVDSPAWGAHNHSLLNLSYGTGKVFAVLHEEVGGVRQGGMLQLPLPGFPTGVMRGRFHPEDHHLYLCGMFAWAGDATATGGLYRLRATGKPMRLPTQLNARRDSLVLTFDEKLRGDALATNLVGIRTWSLKRSQEYGSKHYDERELKIEALSLSDEGRQLRIQVADLQPCWCMEIKYDLASEKGERISGVIHNTIHVLAD